MSGPREYVTVTLSTHEAHLVLAGLLRQGRAMGDRILDGENQGMDEDQLQNLRRRREVSVELMKRIVEALR